MGVDHSAMLFFGATWERDEVPSYLSEVHDMSEFKRFRHVLFQDEAPIPEGLQVFKEITIYGREYPDMSDEHQILYNEWKEKVERWWQHYGFENLNMGWTGNMYCDPLFYLSVNCPSVGVEEHYVEAGCEVRIDRIQDGSDWTHLFETFQSKFRLPTKKPAWTMVAQVS